MLVQRAKVGELARRNQHAAGMHADIARQAFEFARQLQQRAHVFFFAFALSKNRLGLQRVNHLVVFIAVRRRQLQRYRLARLVGNQLGDAVAKAVGKIKHTAHVTNDRPRRHGAEGHDLADRLFAVLVLDIVDHAVAVALTKINVKVGHGHPLGVQKSLEQQVVLQRVQIGDAQRVSHQRAGTRAPARAYRAAVVFGPVDEVTDDQEVAGESHVQDHIDLEVQARHVLGAFFFAQLLVGVQVQQASIEPLVRGMAKVSVDRQAHAIDFRRRVVGQHGFAQLQLQVAALGDLNRVGQGRRNIGEQLAHLRLRLEILLARELAHAPGIAQNFAFRDAHARFVSLVIVAGQKLHRVCGHHRQFQSRSQLHCTEHMTLVIGTPGALHFQVKTVRKHTGQVQRAFHGTRLIALQQRLTHRTGLRAGQRDQAFAEFLQPFKLDDGLVAHHVFCPGAGDQLRQIEVAAPVLHQQQQAGRRGARFFAGHFDPEVSTDQWLDALAAGLLVKLNRAKQIRQVGDGQCRLLIGLGGPDNFIYPVGAVNDGKLCVNTQMNKHTVHFRRRMRAQRNM